MQDMRYWFAKANLPVKIEKESLNSNGIQTNNRDIFQMSIAVRGKKKKREFFRIYHGHKNNEVRIIDTDEKFQQVVLLVHEPPREFTIRRYDWKINKYITEKQIAPEFIRKYLMGMDECYLFICELPNSTGAINKVKDAHRALKPQKVINKEKYKNIIKRQGEWFFIPATFKEEKEIQSNRNFIEKKVSLNSSNTRNAHIADQFINTNIGCFVKGKISHPDHKTLKLHGWYSYIRNNESTSSSTNLNRIYDWVD